ncbi:MAG: methylmalonyl Co-A mutase-associated GTPase MeaB [Thermoplasmata archaeon]|nr:methylmalonyl Co-A mutase-associated GTPase MeaB [Thermoplasmata archaeon]
MDLAEKVLQGDRRAVARLITEVENSGKLAGDILKALHGRTGHAHIIGVTGPPGAGKSTLIDRLAKSYRLLNKKIGIIAIDPSSPFTGGAILGDRIRMSDLNTDPGVYIRSMGTRGHLGGLSRATADVVKILDAFGMDKIIIETVGAGQSEVEIASMAHTTILVEMPGLGDDIQTIKAGIMEIGDIFVVNKADRQGADRTELELRAMLELQSEPGLWVPPILRTVASSNEGITSLRDSIEIHYSHLTSSGNLDKHNYIRTKQEFLSIMREELIGLVIQSELSESQLDGIIMSILKRESDPHTEVSRIIQRFSANR